ncbi:hypothetical protein POM88_015670 [Heracleum sosnowskyi]|uniref:Uncharacterized protein n=1 Tax=Heracleum sosnowskyi TaxID=360622 RepID=A0AAD8INA9_9APIA|nr:hypothetical protein POM88_015670 [Heracleum sosnowskyi]
MESYLLLLRLMDSVTLFQFPLQLLKQRTSSWSWFMDRVKKKVVLRHRDVCVISDRHTGIISSMNNPELGWHEPQGYHRFCARHLAANFAIEPRAEEWFADKALKHWALAFDDGKRFGIMTTNFAESWNNAIKASRKLPVIALVKSIFYKVVEYFDQCRLEIENYSLLMIMSLPSMPLQFLIGGKSVQVAIM